LTTAGRGAARALATLTLIAAALLALSTSAQAAAPANDDFNSAQALSPAYSAEISGSNVEATKQAGEPNHAGNAGGHSVWFSWTPASSGSVSMRAFACFSALKPLVAVYTGSAVNSLIPVADNGNPFSAECFFGEPSAAEFDAQAGTTYWIAVDGRNGGQGSFNLKLEGPPANDDFADAQVVTPASSATLYTNRLATKQAEEPDHAGDPGGHSVWFKWTPSASETASISTCSTSSNLDALLAVYTGTEVGALTEVASNDDSPGNDFFPCKQTDSKVTVAVSAGTTYWIAVDGSQGTLGRFNLQIQGRPSNDDFANAKPLEGGLPVFGSGTTNLATKQAGEPNHAGNAGGHSVWFSWTPSKDVRVRISTCSTEGSLGSLLAVYTGSELGNLTEVASNSVGSNSGCTVGSEVVFNATENTKYMTAVDGKDGDEGNFQISIEPPPANDDFADAQPLGELPISTSGSTRVASKETGEPNHAGDPGGNSVWYSWTPTESGPATISTCPYLETSPDTLLAVYTGTEVGALTEVASNDDSPAACKEMGSEVEIQAKAGTTYRIAVDGKGGSQGIFSLDIEAVGQTNDAFATPQVLAPFPIAPGGSTVGATKEAGEPNHAGNAGGHSVWFEWTPETSGPVDLSACGERPGVDTLLAVYTGTEVNDLAEVASNDDSGTRAPDGRCEESTGNSELVFEAEAGTAYMIAVDTKGSEGRFALDLERGPANDDFANATLLEESMPAYGAGDNKLASKQAGEPNHAGNAGGHSLWFKWTSEKTGSVSVATCTFKTPLDTLLAVYTGAEVNDLTEVASNDNGQVGKGCRATDSEAEFTATTGTTYWIAVDGKEGSSGGFQMFLEGVAPNDDFGKAQSLGGALPTGSQFGSNRFATKQGGEPDHAGNAGGSSVWFKWTAPRSGIVSIDTCGSGFDSLLAVYTGAKLESLSEVASNDDGSGGCAPQSKLTFAGVANTVYRIAVDGKGGAQGPLELHIDSRPKNDDFEDAEVIPGSLGWYWPGYNMLATKQPGEPGDPGGHTVWYSWTPPKTWAVELDACASSFEPQVAIYTGSAVNALTSVPTTDAGSGECRVGRSIAFTTVPGTTYRIAVDGAGGNEGQFELHFRGTAAVTHTLSVSRAGSGSGSVSSSPVGISCGTTCNHDFAAGTAVILTATPAAGSVLTGWSGGGCSGTGSCQLTLGSDTMVTATFEPASGGGGSGGEVIPPPPPPAPKPKPKPCKRGYKKKIVHGKRRCVKKKKHHHRRHHG
jgi:hypothetical protein